MNATEEAVEAAARAYWDAAARRPSMGNDNGVNVRPWEDATPMQKFRCREDVLPLVQAAFSTLPPSVPVHAVEALRWMLQYGPDSTGETVVVADRLAAVIREHAA